MQVHGAMLALHTERPVKIVYSREESFVGHVHRHPAKIWMEHRATREGKLVCVRMRILLDGGARPNDAIPDWGGTALIIASTMGKTNVVQVLLDITANRLHHFHLRVAGNGAGTASKAGAVAGLLGVFRLAVKSYTLATRAPRWAGWPAVYAGGRDCEDEQSVITRISSLYRLPPANFVGAGHLGKFRPVEYRIGHHSVQRLRLRGCSGLSESCGQNNFM
jgi:hypothetical protein